MRTAYINKDNKVVYIAAFEEDKIEARTAEMPSAQDVQRWAHQPKGKLLFGGSSYDAETGKWNHTIGSGEEVFAVDGEGLGVGDIYKPPAPPEPAQEPANKSLLEAISAKQAELQAVRQQILNAQADENEALLVELRPQRDRLKQELAVLEKESK